MLGADVKRYFSSLMMSRASADDSKKTEGSNSHDPIKSRSFCYLSLQRLHTEVDSIALNEEIHVLTVHSAFHNVSQSHHRN
jgi:hypothetical protein